MDTEQINKLNSKMEILTSDLVNIQKSEQNKREEIHKLKKEIESIRNKMFAEFVSNRFYKIDDYYLFVFEKPEGYSYLKVNKFEFDTGVLTEIICDFIIKDFFMRKKVEIVTREEFMKYFNNTLDNLKG